jgi:ankyrin repeat protein
MESKKKKKKKKESQGEDARIIQLLLERSADVKAQDIKGENPLHLAACSGKVQLMHVLLDHGKVATEETYDTTLRSAMTVASTTHSLGKRWRALCFVGAPYSMVNCG